MSLNINNLKQNKNEILKAEIVSLFSLLEKTFTEWWKKRNFFRSFSPFYSDLKKEIERLLTPFKNTTFNLTIKSNGTVTNSPINCWGDFINANWRSWRRINLNNNPEKFLQILYGSCEGINSGIEKGSPSENNQTSKFSDKPYLTNSFGTFKNTVSDKELNKLRELLFNKDLNNLDENYKNNIYNKKILQKNISTILSNLSVNTSIWNIISSRIRIYNLIKILYSAIPSDSRFPANDTSLFDQAYMATSLFKASLADFILRSNSNEIDITNFDHSKIKWSILGIQYDKLELAEKGLKAASIKWYRDTANQVDNKIKRIIEIEYALGNEVYRDETGIYFVVGENVIGGRMGDFYRLNSDLNELKEKIQEVFSDKFEDEIYPAILLTEPSRGLMNLGYLIEKAKENFLKAEVGRLPHLELKEITYKEKKYPQKEYINEENKDKKEPNTAIRICPICKMRLVFKSDLDKRNDPPICEECHNRIHHVQVKRWLDNPGEETIWLDELQDKNGRVALVTLKFELKKWLNGDLVNSLVINTTNYFQLLNKLKNDLNNKNGRNKKLKNTILKDYVDKSIRNLLSLEQLSVNLLLKRSIGSKWEEFIKNNFSDETAIDFGKRKIFWDKLNDQDIEFLATLIIQFLLRKNPSPARLRRIWESTREFFESLKAQVMDLSKIPQWRRKSLIFEGTIKGSFDKDPNKQEKEFEHDGLLYWAVKKDNNKSTVYLISSIERFIKKYGKTEIKKALSESHDDALDSFLGNEDNLKAALTKTQIELEEYIPNKNRFQEQPAKVAINLQDFTIRTYKPYFTILSFTPISWQFIIPAQYVPDLIKNIQKEYYKNFKWVYGKLPLHIGIIVQNYKSPLYVGIKALRKIRRDKVNWEDLKIEINGKELKTRQKTAWEYQQVPEENSQSENFYSLYEKVLGEGKYEFYLYPDRKKVWLDTTQDSFDTDKFNIYPNTIDFEFLDTNTRRNDIYYRAGRRFMKIKRNRPYDLYECQYFERFKKYFFLDKKSSSKLQKLVSTIHTKLENWKGEDESLKLFMKSAFINILELKNKKQQDKFARVLGLTSFEELKNLSLDKFNSKLLMILDMFDLWHKILKFEETKQKEG